MLVASSVGPSLRRAVTARHRLAPSEPQSVDRKTLSAVCRMAEEALDLRAGLRLVLSELVANWGEQGWDRLIVWPSNDHLARRTGLSERTLRDAFRKLIQLGLLVAKDSPNGKRYAVRDGEGRVIDAYGFDLTPLYAGRAIWADLLARKRAERQRIKHAYDEITVARRACAETLAALGTGETDLASDALRARYQGLVHRTPRRGSKAPPAELLDAWIDLSAAMGDAILAASDGETCRHIESNHESFGKACNSPQAAEAPNPPSEAETTQSQQIGNQPAGVANNGAVRTKPPITADTLQAACPAAFQFASRADTAADIVALGRQLRPMLGAGDGVWREATDALGPLRAAIAVILVVQLYDDDAARHGGESRIRNPGGYLRAFIRMVKEGKIDLDAELRSLHRRRLPSGPPRRSRWTGAGERANLRLEA